MTTREVFFEEVCSQDFLEFKFGERGYIDQLNDSITKTGALSAIKVELVSYPIQEGVTQDLIWVAHNFGFLGGSLGCAEGEKITRAFELGLEKNLPVVVECRSGGARMQEGTSSLMQMAKVSVAVQALHEAGLPFISVLCDPTYGGVSASYAMQADVRIAVTEIDQKDDEKKETEARIGFAGPAVILNTMCEANQKVFDERCPSDFQASSFVLKAGQIDMILEVPAGKWAKGNSVGEGKELVEKKVAQIAYMLTNGKSNNKNSPSTLELENVSPFSIEYPSDDLPEDETKSSQNFNYTRSRHIERPQTQDIIREVFKSTFIELSGDGKVGKDASLKGGLALFQGHTPCVVIATTKGHTPTEMEQANYGMPSPHGYRTALRLMKMAEKFNLPVVTLVDTVGAWPTFECEKEGQSEAIATNLTTMAGLKVPIITLMVGEGGSGGALGICMGNSIAMLSGGYFGVISPEGAASILGRYKDEKHKAEQFPIDCQALAKAQCIYAHQLKDLGVVDFIIWEEADRLNGSLNPTEVCEETYKHFPKLQSRIEKYISIALSEFSNWSGAQLVQQRYQKYRKLGTFAILDEEQRAKAIEDAKAASAVSGKKRPSSIAAATPAKLLTHLANEIVLGERSKYRKLAPTNIPAQFTNANTQSKAPQIYQTPCAFDIDSVTEDHLSAKAILEKYGVDYLCKKWLPKQKRTLITDTTMRDAHQSLLATRVRTVDIVEGAKIASTLLKDAFSLECWGGATFDVCMRFLDECPWERLRKIREACPNILLQMLIRGANGVGYTSYADNVVEEFIRLAAHNGMDVFRIFDCFNDVENMIVSINAVKKFNKIAEVCLCYTGNVLTSEIYNLEYYAELAKKIVSLGADILAIKDMAGLLRPLEVEPLMSALRNAVGDDIAIHFHTHATSSGSLATCMEMARCGCNIIDFATASLADGTSQPSLNSFLAMMEGAQAERPVLNSKLVSKGDPKIRYLTLEPYDLYWAGIRDWYSPFESGMKAGTARVFEHQIPGGQYSNLLVQCMSMGLTLDQWSEVCDAYRDVNILFGDIVKVTPSSKCVGDLALYLVLKGLKTSDLINPVTGEIEDNAWNLDLPASIISFFQGDLGFPHRGFPAKIEELVLRKGTHKKHTIRAGLVLPPVDFASHRASLIEKFGEGKDDFTLSEEECMSSLMYPQVFADYLKRKFTIGNCLPYLPSLVYFYALNASDVFSLSIPSDPKIIKELFTSLADDDAINFSKESNLEIEIEVVRISSIQKLKRTVTFNLKLISNGNTLYKQTQNIQVKDNGGVFVFEGPMADPSKPNQVGSPMGGLVDKIFAKVGETVKQGDVLAVISAMKMEVKVSAPCDGVISEVHVPTPGYRVIEGALLAVLK